MKTKITLLIILLTSIFYEASAYTIIIHGSGRTNRYYLVECTPVMLKCVGRGSIYCPFLSGSAQSYASGKWYDFGGIIDFVDKQVSSGIKSGEENYNNDLPVRWKMQEDENTEINIEESGIRGMEEFEDQKQ